MLVIIASQGWDIVMRRTWFVHTLSPLPSSLSF